MVNYEDIQISDLEFSHAQILQTNKRIASIKEDVYRGDDKSGHSISREDIRDDHMVIAPNVTISDCQICIELAAKSMFKSLGVNPPETHDIEFGGDRVSGLFKRLPEDEDVSNKVPRVIFLTQFWERFYALSKYGAPESNISSFTFLTEEDAIRAVVDADFCIDVAKELLEFVLDKKGLERSELEVHLFGPPFEY